MNKIMPYVELLMAQPHFKPVPLSIQINITNRCASKCYFCRKYEWPQEEVDIKDFKSIVRQFASLGGKSIVLSGGDPLSYSNFVEAIDIVKENGIAVGVFTSLVSKNNDNLSCLASKVDKVRVSLDAADKSKYKYIRGVDSFDLVIKNLHDIAAIRRVEKLEKIKLNVVVTRDNISQLMDISNLAGLSGCNVDYCSVHTYDKLRCDVKISKEIFNELAKVEYNNIYELDFDSFLSPICFIPKFHAVIDTDLSVYPCCRMLNDNGDYDYAKKMSVGNLKRRDNSLEYLMALSIETFYEAPKRFDICRMCDRYRNVNNEIFNYLYNKKRIFI